MMNRRENICNCNGFPVPRLLFMEKVPRAVPSSSGNLSVDI